MTSMIRLPTVLMSAAVALAAAGCGQPSAPPAAPPKAQNPGPPMTPNPMPPTYVGRWAATPDLCDTGAWVFTPTGLTTAGEISCNFSQVTPNETGWIAEGACVAQGPAKPASLVLNTTRAGQSRTLAVSGGPFSGSQVLGVCPTPALTGSPLEDAAAIEGRIAEPTGGAVSHDLMIDGLTGKAWFHEGAIIKIVEPVAGDGGVKLTERVYYFRPAQAAPFLVRDPEVTYALKDGKLAAAYSREGAALQAPSATDRAEIEGRLVLRAAELLKAAKP